MKRRLQALLRRFGLLVVSSEHAAAPYLDHWPLSSFSLSLLRRFPSLENLTFIQVGANDGRRFDPIAAFIDRHQWSGLMVEPVPSNFEALSRLRASNPRIVLLRAAVDAVAGHRSIYHLREDVPHAAPDWIWGMASFDREFLLDAVQSLGWSESCIADTKVPTVTWSQLWEKVPHQRCDVLVVDTEGHDVRLLLQLDWDRHRPTLVHFEHKHAHLDDRLALYGKLLGLGYEFSADTEDTTAWLPAPPDGPRPGAGPVHQPATPRVDA